MTETVYYNSVYCIPSEGGTYSKNGFYLLYSMTYRKYVAAIMIEAHYKNYRRLRKGVMHKAKETVADWLFKPALAN